MVSEYTHCKRSWNWEETVGKQLGSKELTSARQHRVVVKWGTMQKMKISLFVWHETQLQHFRTDKQLAIVQEKYHIILGVKISSQRRRLLYTQTPSRKLRDCPESPITRQMLGKIRLRRTYLQEQDEMGKEGCCGRLKLPLSMTKKITRILDGYA